MQRDNSIPQEIKDWHQEHYADRNSSYSDRVYDAADRMLSPNMSKVYAILRNQGAQGGDWSFLFEAFTSPLNHDPKEKDKLISQKNKLIGKKNTPLYEKARNKANELAALLSEIHEIETESAAGIYTSMSDPFDILEMVNNAAELDLDVKYKFKDYVQPAIKQIRASFTFGYVPSTEFVIQAIANELHLATTKSPQLPIQLESQQSTWRDHLRILIENLCSLNRIDTHPISGEKIKVYSDIIGGPFRLREADFHIWVTQIIKPRHPASLKNVAAALKNVSQKLPTELFLLKT